MDDDRISKLTEAQRDCLRLVRAHYQIKEIAAALKIAPSTVNARLERARRTLGAHNSNEAARMLAQHEERLGLWIPPTGSSTPIPQAAALRQDRATTGSKGQGDAVLADSGATVALEIPVSRTDKRETAWPFPSAGRQENELSSLQRIIWVFPIAALSLGVLLLLIVLSLGFQEVLGGLEHKIAAILHLSS